MTNYYLFELLVGIGATAVITCLITVGVILTRLEWKEEKNKRTAELEARARKNRKEEEEYRPIPCASCRHLVIKNELNPFYSHRYGAQEADGWKLLCNQCMPKDHDRVESVFNVIAKDKVSTGGYKYEEWLVFSKSRKSCREMDFEHRCFDEVRREKKGIVYASPHDTFNYKRLINRV